MTTIRPQEPLALVYQISDPNDSTTYYVRAVVRDSTTGSIIQIAGANYVNLTDAGSGRFSSVIEAPQDPSGSGRQIDITLTVYEDSGYTTKSSNYEQSNTKYLIGDRWSLRFRGGGSAGGMDFTPGQLTQAIRNAIESSTLADRVKKLETGDSKDEPTVAPSTQKQEKVDLSPVLSAMEAFRDGMNSMKNEIAALKAPIARTERLASLNDEGVTKASNDIRTTVQGLEGRLSDMEKGFNELNTLSGYMSDIMEKLSANKMMDESFITKEIAKATKGAIAAELVATLAKIMGVGQALKSMVPEVEPQPAKKPFNNLFAQ